MRRAQTTRGRTRGGAAGGHQEQWTPSPPPLAASLPAAPPPAAPLSRSQIVTYLIDVTVQINMCIVQIMNVKNFREKAVTLHGRTHTLVVLAAMALCLSVIVLFPRFFLRHRLWLLPGLQLAVVATPSVRQTGVGMSLALERAARPGWAGMLKDFFTVLAGCRLVLIMVQGLGMMLPPAAAWAVQGVLLACVWNPRAYCGTALLMHPLTQQRLRVVESVLDALVLPFVSIANTFEQAPEDALDAGSDQHAAAVCRAAVSFLQVTVGLILPALTATYMWSASAEAAGPAGRHSSTEAPAGSGARERLLAAMERASGAMRTLNCGLRATLFGPPAYSNVLWWTLLAHVWLWCKLVAEKG